MHWFKVISAASYIFGWFGRATKDGKITTDEAIQLVTDLLGILGLSLEIDIPTPPSATTTEPPKVTYE